MVRHTQELALSFLDVHGALLVEFARVAALAEVLVWDVVAVHRHAVHVLPHTTKVNEYSDAMRKLFS